MDVYEKVDPRLLKNEELLERLDPRGSRIIISKPEASCPEEYVREGVVVLGGTVAREFGLIAKVLKCSPQVKAEFPELEYGDLILVTEFAGIPLYLGRETPYWIVGTGDIIARLTGDDIEVPDA